MGARKTSALTVRVADPAFTQVLIAVGLFLASIGVKNQPGFVCSKPNEMDVGLGNGQFLAVIASAYRNRPGAGR